MSSLEIQKLREATGAGVMECKRAFDDAKGDFEKAKALIAERGLARAEKKQDRALGAGFLKSYIHNGRVGVLLEVRAETDFVVRSEPFQALVQELVLQIAAMDPADVETLLKQPYVKDESKTIDQLVKSATATVASTSPSPGSHATRSSVMANFILELILLLSASVALYLLARALPRVDDVDTSTPKTLVVPHWLTEHLENADELLLSFLEKMLRRVRVGILKMDNTLTKKLSQFKKEPEKEAGFPLAENGKVGNGTNGNGSKNGQSSAPSMDSVNGEGTR